MSWCADPARRVLYLARAGLVTRPAKRPRSSYLWFEAELPNECWQAGFTHYPLADGTGSEILTWLDDHSRLVLSLKLPAWYTGTRGPSRKSLSECLINGRA